MRFVILLVVLGCSSGKKERPPAVSDEMVATLDRDAALARKVAGELDAAKGDCKAAAKVVIDNTKAIAAAAKESKRFRALSKDDVSVKEWINATYKTDDNLAAEAAIKRVAKDCERDPNYQAAMALQQAATSSN